MMFNLLSEDAKKQQVFHDLLKNSTKSALTNLLKRAHEQEKARLELQLKAMGIGENDYQYTEEIFNQDLRHKLEINNLAYKNTDEMLQQGKKILEDNGGH